MSNKLRYAMYPEAYKAGMLLSQVPTSTVGDFEVERTGVATRVNKDGLIEVVAENVPRLDYSDGGCPKLLTEAASTNYVTDAINGVIVLQTDVSNKVVSPSGLVDATVPIPVSDINSRFVGIIPPNTLSTNDIVTYSWYRKRLSTPIGQFPAFGDLYIQSGSINIQTIGETKQIASDVNGFDRFQSNGKIIDGSLESTFNAFIGYVTGLEGSVAYYGHQLEKGSEATSLIYTNGSTEQRGAESVTNAGDSSTFNSESGVLFADVKALSDTSTLDRLITLKDTDNSTTYIIFGVKLNGDLRFVYTSSNGSASFTLANYDVTMQNKIALSWKDNLFSVYINGVTFYTELSFTTASVDSFKKLSLVNSVSGNAPFIGKTKSIQHWDYLTDEEMESLTGYQSYSAMTQQFNFNTL